jgi:iron complex transport system permease protein
MDKRQAGVAVMLSMTVCVLAMALCPLTGTTQVNLAAALDGISPHREVLFDLRLTRVLLGALAGGCLSLAGALFQGLLRDALATPYTLGVSSGASLGAVVALTAGLALPAVWGTSILGAGVVLALVMRLASGGGRLSSFTLLLAGVTINSMCLALILFLHSTASFVESFAITRWLMGGIEPVEFRTLGWLALVTLPVCMLVILRARDWNLLAVGEEWAQARGVDAAALTRTGYVTGSILAGAITALTGPIGFVGLIVPHALRLRYGADHRLLLACSFFWGAAFLTVSDTLARTLMAPSEVPVGVITALAGGPFFLWLLHRRRSLWL